MRIHFACICNKPPFASKQTFARIDFLRQGGCSVGRKGTYNVKFLAENYTKKNVPNTRVLATERQAGTFADGQRMLLQCMQPTADGESSMEIQRTSAIGSLSSACGRYME